MIDAQPSGAQSTEDPLRRLAVAVQDLAWAVDRTKPARPDLGWIEPLPPTELQVVRYVSRHEGASVGVVAAALGLQQSNVSTAVRGLARRGLVDRERDPADRRVTRLRATARSAAHRDPVEGGWARSLAEALAGQPAADRRAVLAAVEPLRRLADAMVADAAADPWWRPGRSRSTDQVMSRRKVVIRPTTASTTP